MSDRKGTNHARLFCGAAGAALLLYAGAAQAQAARRIEIPPQSLASALHEFGVQSGHQVLFKSSATTSKASPGVTAEGDMDAALAQLLAGTGLSFRRAGDVFLIEPEGGSGPQSGSAAGDGADGTVEALIVTAQKREEDIQDVPIAISAFTQEDLTRSQVAGGPDLMTQVPNMTFTKTNFSSYSIQLRGIGTQAISATTDPAVAVAFNNTPFVRNHFFEQEFYDLQRVEVLRGPQGTLYGRNATAGVVNVISAKANPSRFEAKLAGDIANYSSHRLEGMVNIPLVEDKAALRLAGAWTKRDGFVTNLLTGDQTDGRDLWSGRMSLMIEPTDWLRADLIYERFEEKDDRLRSGKQLCHKDLGPDEIGGVPVVQGVNSPFAADEGDFSQGCKPASLYSPDSFQTPNGYALPYYGAAAGIGSPVYGDLDPYASETQSRNLREIETHIKPEYEAVADLWQFQLQLDLSSSLALVSETGFAKDYIFSFQDFNRFDTKPGVFVPGMGVDPPRYDVIDENGVFCDPQIGCTNRLAGADVATAQSQQFSQEFRLSSNYDAPFNFNLGANFLRYDTEDKYYVFINSLSIIAAGARDAYVPGVSDNAICFETNVGNINRDKVGYVWSNPNAVYQVDAGNQCHYIDPNDIHNLNDQGRNYFLSKNPYSLLSYSAFGEIYYDVAPNLKITGGFRWTVDKKTAPQVPSWLVANQSYGTPTRKVVELEWREPTGRLAIDWKPKLSFTDDTLLYASYVHGYKAGGANPPPPIVVLPPVCPPNCFEGNLPDLFLAESLTHPESFDPEFVDAYEIGAKNTLLDGKLTLNLGAFYYDYTGYQISQIVNRSSVNLNFDAEVWGLEIEADWRPIENLRLGFKGGYENTRMADGSSAIDLMDRTAGREGWVLIKPFPPAPSNCIVPVWLVAWDGILRDNLCYAYTINVDPFTVLPYVPDPTVTLFGGSPPAGYPGFDPASAPNNGEGFAKDLGGNELPNAPDYTATITADYTLPLPNDWLMTLHTDFYYQSEAWTRVFNTDGYDKLKAYNNINFAAIFTNEDAGWRVMAYVKNLLDRDSITGSFLNSDDTGLTTNVFLTEPRLYGVRIIKNWTGDSSLGSLFRTRNPGEPYVFRLDLGGSYSRLSQDHELLAPPTTQLFPSDFSFPFAPQEDLDWGTETEARFTYQPRPGGWLLSAAARYGRATGNAGDHTKGAVAGGFNRGPTSFFFDPSEFGIYNYAETVARNDESHTIVDFAVGKDVGLGSVMSLSASTLRAGLRYAHLRSASAVTLHGRPDLYFPPEFIVRIGARMHRVHGEMDAVREFGGAGPVLSWEGSRRLAGDTSGAGEFRLEVGLGGSVLFGKQTTEVDGEVRGDYVGGLYSLRFAGGPGRHYISGPYVAPIRHERVQSVTVPSLNASVGLSFTMGGTTVSGGYRWERFFDAIDGGLEEREEYDRTIDGPYFKLSVGFGG